MEKMYVHRCLLRALVRGTNLPGSCASGVVRDILRDCLLTGGQELSNEDLLNQANVIVDYLVGFIGRFPRKYYNIAKGDDASVIDIIEDFLDWSELRWTDFQREAECIFKMDAGKVDWDRVLRDTHGDDEKADEKSIDQLRKEAGFPPRPETEIDKMRREIDKQVHPYVYKRKEPFDDGIAIL